jgi:hypothetical protein
VNTTKKKAMWFAAALFALILMIHYFFYQSEFADAARSAVLKDPAVVEACGENIEVNPWFLARHSYSSYRENAHALLHFRCVGSRSSVRVTVEMERVGETWNAKRVTIDS